MTWPHCDARILHAPGECEYCDERGDLQLARTAWGINFTGHYEPEMYLCPAEDRRDLGVIEQWGGNVKAPIIPSGAEVQEVVGALARLRKVVRRPT